MHVRRIVTGVDADGASTFIHDGPAPRSHDMVHTPTMASAVVWATDPSQPARADGSDPTPELTSVLPSTPGSTVMLVVDLPPDAVMMSDEFDPAAAFGEQAEVSPGLLEHFEPDAPGFHTTPTVDYLIMLDGELYLELDNGRETLVKPGDVVIQNATRHAWRNRTDRPARFAVVFVAPAAG
jgi:mannose-6-phosphate isomerase-like protein (cupin superfamily)